MEKLIEYKNVNVSTKIIEKARYLFNQIGVRNTTMDDLARELGISKKTLYKEIDNKADLVRICVLSDLKAMENKIKDISAKYDNAIEEMLVINEEIIDDIKVYHPSVLHDLMKFYPECCEMIETHKSSFAHQSIANNLAKGIKQGFYREDIRIELVTLFQINLSMLPLEQKVMLYDTKDMFFEILKFYIHAITTPKGIKEFYELINKRDKK